MNKLIIMFTLHTWHLGKLDDIIHESMTLTHRAHMLPKVLLLHLLDDESDVSWCVQCWVALSAVPVVLMLDEMTEQLAFGALPLQRELLDLSMFLVVILTGHAEHLREWRAKLQGCRCNSQKLTFGKLNTATLRPDSYNTNIISHPNILSINFVIDIYFINHKGFWVLVQKWYKCKDQSVDQSVQKSNVRMLSNTSSSFPYKTVPETTVKEIKSIKSSH